jgi:hypothetical protein
MFVSKRERMMIGVHDVRPLSLAGIKAFVQLVIRSVRIPGEFTSRPNVPTMSWGDLSKRKRTLPILRHDNHSDTEDMEEHQDDDDDDQVGDESDDKDDHDDEGGQ